MTKNSYILSGAQDTYSRNRSVKAFLKSIKGRLAVLFFLFLSIFLILLDGVIYKEVKSLLLSSVDHLLHSKSQIVKGLLHVEHGVVELELTEIVSGEYSVPRSGHYYKVVMDGRVLAASESLVDMDFDLSRQISDIKHRTGNETFYTSTGPAGEPVRVLKNTFKFLDKETTVYVASSLADSLELLARLRYFLIISTPVILLITGIGAYWIASLSLKPLRRFSDEIEKVTHRTLGQKIQEPGAEELKGLASTFNSMLDRLRRAFEIEKRILSDASHELKTPLSVILAESDVTLQKKRTAGEYEKSLLFIKEKAESMKKTLNDILNLAKLDSGLLRSGEFKELSINDCLSRAIEMVSPSARKKKIEIRFNAEAAFTIKGDKDRLTEAFLNLLDNAIMYNHESGHVDVSISPDNSNIVIQIKDTGVGIKQDELDKIFNRFYRSAEVRNREGTGLGLNIAREIIDAHGGEIRVESTPGRGSNFIILFPEPGIL